MTGFVSTQWQLTRHNLPQVLTPKQFGKAVVQSYPFYLDGTVLVELLATDGQTQHSVPPGPLPPVSTPFSACLLPQPHCSQGWTAVAWW